MRNVSIFSYMKLQYIWKKKKRRKKKISMTVATLVYSSLNLFHSVRFVITFFYLTNYRCCNCLAILRYCIAKSELEIV